MGAGYHNTALCHQHRKARAAPWSSRMRALCCGLSSRPRQPHTFFLVLPSMVRADFGAAAALISTRAVLGRVNPVQMLLLTLLGVTLFTLNEYILLSLLGVSHCRGDKPCLAYGANPPPCTVFAVLSR